MVDVEHIVARNAVRYTRGRSNAAAYYDDLLQVGRIALWQAKDTLAASDSAYVAYAAGRIVRRAMGRFMRLFIGWGSGRKLTEDVTAAPTKKRSAMSKKERAATPVKTPTTHSKGGAYRFRATDNDIGSDSEVWMFLATGEAMASHVETRILVERIHTVAREVLTADQLKAFHDESYKPHQRYVAFAKVERRCREVWLGL